MPHTLIKSLWAYDLCNTETLGKFKEVSAHEQVFAMNRRRILNSSTLVLNAPTKLDIKRVLFLSIPWDIERKPLMQTVLFKSHFVEVVTATESDVTSKYSKEAKNCNSGQVGIIYISDG